MEQSKEPQLDGDACGDRRPRTLDLDAWRQDLQRLHVTIDQVVQTFIASQTRQLDAVATELSSQRDRIESEAASACIPEAEAQRLQDLGFDVLSIEDDASREALAC
ncbi:unnamed protein product [Symbiodinium natans]|uniref:Uncharacterized protein n=1 Tax=Symbiodinium natans TaxID=878477 RepID=A0A812PVI0_9DINO|nr:unnamed protein product [Symbiodinium natans]